MTFGGSVAYLRRIYSAFTWPFKIQCTKSYIMENKVSLVFMVYMIVKKSI